MLPLSFQIFRLDVSSRIMRSSYDGHNEFVAGLTSIQPSKLGPVDIWFNEGAWDRKTQATQLSIAPYRTAHITTLAICRILAFNCDTVLYHSHYPRNSFTLNSVACFTFWSSLEVSAWSSYYLFCRSIARGLRAGGDGAEDVESTPLFGFECNR
jgi:hypothetical protein